MKSVLAIVALVASTTAFAKTNPIPNADAVKCAAVQSKLKINGFVNLYIGNAGKNHPTLFTTDDGFCGKDEALDNVWIQTADTDTCLLTTCVAK